MDDATAKESQVTSEYRSAETTIGPVLAEKVTGTSWHGFPARVVSFSVTIPTAAGLVRLTAAVPRSRNIPLDARQSGGRREVMHLLTAAAALPSRRTRLS